MKTGNFIQSCDHCRIGSLEMVAFEDSDGLLDHCRIGSLETQQNTKFSHIQRSLPHRQLRNAELIEKL